MIVILLCGVISLSHDRVKSICKIFVFSLVFFINVEEMMAVGIQITLNERLYLRDPQQTELGKKIIKHSILLIDQIGLTLLSKLLKQCNLLKHLFIDTLSQHMLLLYLVSWFWEWVNI